jgi:hypothetical protein
LGKTCPRYYKLNFPAKSFHGKKIFFGIVWGDLTLSTSPQNFFFNFPRSKSTSRLRFPCSQLVCLPFTVVGCVYRDWRETDLVPMPKKPAERSWAPLVDGLAGFPRIYSFRPLVGKYRKKNPIIKWTKIQENCTVCDSK